MRSALHNDTVGKSLCKATTGMQLQTAFSLGIRASTCHSSRQGALADTAEISGTQI